jgi:hypothetical protein
MKKLTLIALLIALPAFANTHHKPKQTQPDPARVREIQEALVQQNRLPAVTGKWDEPTWNALRDMAQEHGWSTCHVPDARVLNILGLGSSTAGIAAPAPNDQPDKLAAELAKYEAQHPEECDQWGKVR